MKQFKFFSIALIVAIIGLSACSSSSNDENILESSEKGFVKYEVKGAVTTIDEENYAITLTYPYGTVLDEMTFIPVFQLKEGTVLLSEPKEEELLVTEVYKYKLRSQDYTIVTYKVSAAVEIYDTAITGVSKTEVAPSDEIIINGQFARKVESVIPVGANSVKMVWTDVSDPKNKEIVDLEIINEEENKLTVKIPDKTVWGEYELFVTSNLVEVVYEVSHIKVDYAKPILVSLDKESYALGVDKIEVTGENLSSIINPSLTQGKAYLRSVGGGLSQAELKYTLLNATLAIADINYGDVEIGEYEIYFKIDNRETNAVTLNLKESTYATPVITLVPEKSGNASWSWSYITVSLAGTDLKDLKNGNAVLELYKGVRVVEETETGLETSEIYTFYKTETVASSYITDTEIKFRYNSAMAVNNSHIKFKVRANGKTSAFSSTLTIGNPK